MKCWRKMCGAILLVIASSCSALAQTPIEDLEKRLPQLSDAQLRPALEETLEDPEAGNEDLLDWVDELTPFELRRVISLRADAARASRSIDAKDAERAKAIKESSPLYRDSGARSGSNWIARALESLQRFLNRPSDRRPPRITPPALNAFAQGLIYLVWVVLGGLLVAFLYFAFRHFSWRAQLRRRARAVLADDEPDYSLDEWLQQADLLEAQGKYREAVRALFLACLLRFDEARIARFVRGETNWEHFRRIEQSPARPPDLDFREPTRAFDRIWYGMDVRGAEDVANFRRWYVAVTEATRRRST